MHRLLQKILPNKKSPPDLTNKKWPWKQKSKKIKKGLNTSFLALLYLCPDSHNKSKKDQGQRYYNTQSNIRILLYWHYTILYYTTDVPWSINYVNLQVLDFSMAQRQFMVSRNYTLNYKFWSFYKLVSCSVILLMVLRSGHRLSSPSSYTMSRTDNALHCPQTQQ